ncbi:hypothetical protein F383_12680 [Gossypium arboreum]|nr:hypothetical protein F383_12680 [Gossypium arboreum]
MSLSSPS